MKILFVTMTTFIVLVAAWIRRDIIFNLLAGRPKLRRFAKIFSPPRSNSPLFEIELLEKEGALQGSVTFEHELAGWYQLGLIVEKQVENPILHPLLLEAKCDWQVGDHSATLLQGQINLATPWWSGTNRSGFRLKIYAVPDDVPRKSTGRLTLSVGGAALQERYGRVRFFIAPLNIW